MHSVAKAHFRRSGQQENQTKMSTSVMGEQNEFKRRLAIRLCISSVALIAGIFPIAAWGFQMPAFHPLGPSRPAVRRIQPASAPATGRVSAPAKSMGKLSPEARKRIEKEKRKAAKQAQTSGKRGR
jgi:hypothetical protein